MKSQSIKPPKFLYHGSKFDNEGKPLYPGFHFTGEVVVWDGGLETNEFLYATTVASEAILLGLGSLIEKDYGADRYECGPGMVVVHNADPKLTEKVLKGLTVYMYTIVPKQNGGWVKVNNPFNNIDTEWKTNRPVEDYVKVAVEIGPWLKKNGYELHFKRKGKD